MKYIKNHNENDIVDVRFDIFGVYDAKMTNPNGDPNADNYPRTTSLGYGYTTSSSFKRKIRDVVAAKYGDKPGFKIFVNDGMTMEEKQKDAYAAFNLQKKAKVEGKDKKSKLTAEEDRMVLDYILKNYYDARTFGQVLGTTSCPCTNVCGPVQVSTPQTFDKVILIEDGIICKGFRNDDKDNQRGNKKSLEYGAYLFAISVCPTYAKHSNFTYGDLDIMIDALHNLFSLPTDSKTGMCVRKLWMLEHPDMFGHGQFELIKESIKAVKKNPDEIPHCYDDYEKIYMDMSMIYDDIKVTEFSV